MTANVLSRKALLVSLHIRRWNPNKRDQEATTEVIEKHNASAKSGAFVKVLVNPGAMQKLNSAYNLATQYHKWRTLPWLQDGTRILPASLFVDYTKNLRTFKETFDSAVVEFVEEYPDHVKKAKTSLGTLFNANDYPPIEDLEKLFKLDWTMQPCPDSKTDFRVELNKADIDYMKVDLETKMRHQMGVALKEAGERVAEKVGHMAERLKAYDAPPPPKKGKAKKNVDGETRGASFRESLVESVKELAELLPSFNLNNDPGLRAIHKRMRDELARPDITGDALRKDSALRKQVAKSATEIFEDVKAFMA